MKYTIADVQQDKLIELGLDVKDAFIITYIKELCGSKKIIQKTVSGKTFYWIDYKNISKYLPVLGLNCIRAISKRFSKYEELELMTRHMHKKFNRVTGVVEGSYNFICFEEKFQQLFEISKIDEDLEEMNKMAEILGLSSMKNDDSPRTEKYSPSGTDVLLMETESPFLSYDKNDGSSHNTTNNYTPIKNTTTTNEPEPKETPLEKNSSSPSSNPSLRYLEKEGYSKMNFSTKTNIIKFHPTLSEDAFDKFYKLAEREVSLGFAKDFNAILYQGICGLWNFRASLSSDNSQGKKLIELATVPDINLQKYKFEILEKISNHPNLGSGWKNSLSYEISKLRTALEISQLLKNYKIEI